MSTIIVHRYEVRVIRTQVHRRIYVLDRESEWLGQLCEALYVDGIVEKADEISFKVVVTRHHVEDAMIGFVDLA